MPKLGMEPIRRAALVNATIAEIGLAGSLDVTVAQIAKRAEMSSALAHHYFGAKDQMFLAAMRHILSTYSTEVRLRLARSRTPRARLEAIIRASFEAGNFRPEVIAAWLNFYVHAQNVDGASRLLTVYQTRLRSNLIYALRPLVGGQAPEIALNLAALIDGHYIRQALGADIPDEGVTADRVLRLLDLMLADAHEK